jgi:hypothetical protein
MSTIDGAGASHRSQNPLPTPQVTAFVAGVTKPVGCLMPRPAVQKRRRKQLPPDFEPRRSSRLQKKGSRAPAAGVRSIRVDLTRRLGLMQDREVLEQDALEEYGRLFSKPLTQEHVAALAALFGWAIPC